MVYNLDEGDLSLLRRQQIEYTENIIEAVISTSSDPIPHFMLTSCLHYTVTETFHVFFSPHSHENDPGMVIRLYNDLLLPAWCHGVVQAVIVVFINQTSCSTIILSWLTLCLQVSCINLRFVTPIFSMYSGINLFV